MEAQHCAGQTLCSIFNEKRYLEGLFDGYTGKDKDPGFNFCKNYFKMNFLVLVVIKSDVTKVQY